MPLAFSIGDSSGNLTINIKGAGASVTTYTLPVAAPTIAKCRQFDPPFAHGGNKYGYVCFSIAGGSTTLQAIGTNGSSRTTGIGTSIPLGSGLDDLVVVAPAEFK